MKEGREKIVTFEEKTFRFHGETDWTDDDPASDNFDSYHFIMSNKKATLTCD